MEALSLLSGDAQTFVQEVWASRVHIHHSSPEGDEGVVELLSLADVDHLLTSTAIRTPAVRIARDGTVLPASAYTRRGASIAGETLTGLVEPAKVLDLFEGGATVVLQGLHRYWPPLTRLVAELEASLGHPCQANAYLTPPGSQGFAVHSDAHDVFVFQTHGTKQWEVHEGGEAREVLMEPGVSMYLPTGTPHAARAREGVSLHVTVGINQLTWRAVVGRLVEDAVAQVPDEHLPAGWAQDPERLRPDLGERLRQVAKELEGLPEERATRRLQERFLTQRNPRLGGGLLDRAALAGLADDTELRRRPGSVCVPVPAEDDRLRLLLGDRSILVPARIAGAVDVVRRSERLRPADLAEHLDQAGRLTLCRRLVREGLLEVAR